MSFKDAPKCDAKSKRTQKTCKNIAMPNGKCRFHGGKAPQGIASGTFKTGRYSKFLPQQLGAKYNDAINDPEINTQREGIALIDGLLQERLEKLYKGESREFWIELKTIYKCFVDEFREIRKLYGTEEEFPEYIGDFTFEESDREVREELRLEKLERANQFIREMGEVLERGRETWDVYEKVADMVELKAKLKTHESKRLKDLDQMISAEKALMLVAHLAGIIQRNVSNPTERAAVSLELAATVIN